MIELYEFPPTRSQRAKWVLEELELDYESHLVDMTKGEQNSDDYHTVHPLGVVPALKTDGYTIFESAAIVMQLIDEHPHSNLAPAVGTPERASYYQWCVFAASEMDPAVMTVFDNTMRPLEAMRPKGRQPDEKQAEYGQHHFKIRAEILSNALADQDYLLGTSFSGADILIGHSLFMASHIGLKNDGDFPVLDAYIARLQQRPAYQRTYTIPS